MANVRWNFRLGPLQFTSPVGLISTAFVAGAVLCCCGAGIIGAFSDPPESPPPAVVESSAPATPDAVESAEPTDEPTDEPTEQAGTGGQLVTAGAFCSTAGELGVTKTGTPMVCRGPGDLRWRKR